MGLSAMLCPPAPGGCLLMESLTQRRNHCLLRISLSSGRVVWKLFFQLVCHKYFLITYYVLGSGWDSMVNKRAMTSMLIETMELSD